MGRFSVSINDEVQERVEEVAEEDHDGNRSAAVETLLRRGLEFEDVVNERDDLEARLEDLRRQLATVRSREGDVDELVEYVETERSLQERRARAGLMTRLRWFVSGMDDLDDDRRRDAEDRDEPE
jgi:predicted transcriptional regulator